MLQKLFSKELADLEVSRFIFAMQGLLCTHDHCAYLSYHPLFFCHLHPACHTNQGKTAFLLKEQEDRH